MLKQGIDDAIEQWVFRLSKEGFAVEKNALGYNAALLGAAAVAMAHQKTAAPPLKARSS